MTGLGFRGGIHFGPGVADRRALRALPYTTSPTDRIVRCILAAIAGCVLAAISLLLYNVAAFGSAFKLGYSSVVGFEYMQTGFLGINLPRLNVLFHILVGERRGLARLSPALVAAPFVLLVMWNSARNRAVAIVIAAVMTYYLLMNSAYYYWDGGWSTGPRHLTPTVPFLTLSLVFLWARVGAIGRLCSPSCRLSATPSH